MKLPDPDEAQSAWTRALSDALNHRCPTCLKTLSGHRYCEFANASESDQNLVTELLLAYKRRDWRALRTIQHVDLSSDIWNVTLLNCPSEATQALLINDPYEPVGLSLVNSALFDLGMNEQLEWFNFTS